ncbi:Chondroitinase-AC [Leucoagaricus sp. SymC.cos]|nr:Chondroitinase-AC [Leucoagaricus sp. SymC.cos]
MRSLLTLFYALFLCTPFFCSSVSGESSALGSPSSGLVSSPTSSPSQSSTAPVDSLSLPGPFPSVSPWLTSSGSSAPDASTSSAAPTNTTSPNGTGTATVSALPTQTSDPSVLAEIQLMQTRRIDTIVGSQSGASNISAWMSSLGADGKWPDNEVDYTTGCPARRANWPAQVHWQRLLVMAAAWHGGLEGGEEFVGDANLHSKISVAMDYWFGRDLTNLACLNNGGTATCPCDNPGNLLWNTNWFSNVILIPALVGPTCLLLNDTLTTSQFNHCINITGRSYDLFLRPFKEVSFLTGANVLDVAKIGIDGALLNLNVTQITGAYEHIHGELVIQEKVKADGIRPDGAFGQHAGVLYNGNYGKDFTNDILDLEVEAAQTRFAANADAQSALATLFEGDRWMIYHNNHRKALQWDFVDASTSSAAPTNTTSPNGTGTATVSALPTQTSDPSVLAEIQLMQTRRIDTIVGSQSGASNISAWMSSLGADGKWPDNEVDYTTGCPARRANWPAQVHWQRLLVMAAAWHGGLEGGEEFVGDANLHSKISVAMDYWFGRDLTNLACLNNGGTATCPCDNPGNLLWNTNWFSNVILIPALVGPTCLLLNDTLTTSQFNHCINITGRSYDLFLRPFKEVSFLTGANVLDVAKIGIDGALLNLNVTQITGAYEHIHGELVIQEKVKADGIRPDGAFGQHAGVLYNGNYGKDFTNDILDLEVEAAQTRFAANAEAQSALATLFEGDRWMIYHNNHRKALQWDFSVLGRFISFPADDDLGAVGSIHLNLTKVKELGQLWNSATMIDFARSLSEPGRTANAGKLLGNRMFYTNDYMVHRGRNYVQNVRAHLTPEALKVDTVLVPQPFGFHLSDGVRYTYIQGDEYEDISAAWETSMGLRRGPVGSINLNLTKVEELGQLWNSATIIGFSRSLSEPGRTANAGKLLGNRMFYTNDYMVHRGRNYVSTLKMYSPRTDNSECVNSQNVRAHLTPEALNVNPVLAPQPFGFHLSDGVRYTYIQGDEYEDISAAWDWNLIPGITTDYGATNLSCSQTEASGIDPFVGGVSNGKVGMAVMQYTNPLTKALSWQKAWFFLDGGVEHTMISNITSTSGKPVLTVLDQRRHDGPIFIDDGEEFRIPQAFGPSTLYSTGSLWHGGVGYSLSGISHSDTLKVEVAEKTGNWSSIGTSTFPPVTVDLFAAWIEHGDLSSGISYSTFPGTTFPEFLVKQSQLRLQSVANDESVAAVYDEAHQTVMVAFWGQSGGNVTITPSFPRFAPLTVSASANAAIIYSFDDAAIFVSDPSQSLTSVEINLSLGPGRKPPRWGPGQDKSFVIQLPSSGLAGSNVRQDF